MAQDKSFAPTALTGLREGPDPSDQTRPIEDCYRDFLRVAPPAFDGISSSEVAEAWLLLVVIALHKFGIPEECWVRFVERHLVGSASEWWCAFRVSLSIEHVHWSEFRSAFIARFITPEHRAEVVSGNRQIIQGIKTVREYRIEFETLVQFFPTLAPTEEAKTHLFIQGLKPKIRLTLAVCTIHRFVEAVEIAARVERTINECKEITNRSKKFKKTRTAGSSFTPNTRVPTCFHCHEEGHKRAHCPQLGEKHQARAEKLNSRRK